jgi:cytochrome c-type biogenesis protein CcmH/NrfF
VRSSAVMVVLLFSTLSLADEALERRVTGLAHELRCLVCQNQTIADSNAPLAVDLRNQIREQLAAGKSDGDVIDFMVARYGDFVLYRPPLKAATLLLWAGPFLFLVLGLFFLFRFLRQRQVPAPQLSDTERAQAAKLLE